MKSIPQILFPNARFLRAVSASAVIIMTTLPTWDVVAGQLAPEQGGPAGPTAYPADPESHKVIIKRETEDEKQLAMITAAEAAQPSEAVLRQASESREDGNGPLGLAEPKEARPPVGDKVWWYKETIGIRIPCAITGDAISYYSELIARNAKQTFKSYAKPSSQLDYHASIQFHNEFELDGKMFKDVNVVSLTLNFAANFTAEATSGLSFEKRRIVVIDAGSKVIHVSGDGPTEARHLML